jgi:hypothetical protein
MATQVKELREPQCQYVSAHGPASGGYLACGRGAGHEGPHVSVYELTWDWITRDEYEEKHAAPARAAHARLFRYVAKKKRRKRR